MNTKFKVGDKVYCVKEHTSDGYNLQLGKEYVVGAICELAETIRLREIYGNWSWDRFILAKSKHEKKSMNNKKIAIKVGNNQELSRIVQEFLFSKGYGWRAGVGAVYQNKHKFAKNIVIYPDVNKTINWDAYNIVMSGYTTYCAATQFGEIVTLLSEPPKPAIKIKNDAGTEYEADFVKNPGYVTFGCATIANDVFSRLKHVLFDIKIDLRNSKTVEQIKIGRGLFSPADIKAIVEHPDFNKSC